MSRCRLSRRSRRRTRPRKIRKNSNRGYRGRHDLRGASFRSAVQRNQLSCAPANRPSRGESCMRANSTRAAGGKINSPRRRSQARKCRRDRFRPHRPRFHAGSRPQAPLGHAGHCRGGCQSGLVAGNGAGTHQQHVQALRPQLQSQLLGVGGQRELARRVSSHVAAGRLAGQRANIDQVAAGGKQMRDRSPGACAPRPAGSMPAFVESRRGWCPELHGARNAPRCSPAHRGGRSAPAFAPADGRHPRRASRRWESPSRAPPRRPIPRPQLASDSAPRAAMTTCAPAAENACAIARPSPL